LKPLDVLVAGAGPAGSTLAALLAERGWEVLLVDRATFPRAKPCAEYLSPEANRVLDRLGVIERLDLAGAVRLHGMRVVSPRGTSFIGRFVAGHGYHGYRDYGLAVRREVLDTELVRAAERRGAMVREGTTVEGLGPAGRHGREVRLRHAGAASSVHARLVVGADGLNSRVARMLHLSRRHRCAAYDRPG
jgi:2-polyprenyl-6-methoxyphenol hydroxylase-like FAD-dependent oxidoreductase